MALGEGTVGFETSSSEPDLVAGGLAFRQVNAGSEHSCGLTTANVAYCWGNNAAGQLGDGSTTARLTPVAVAAPAP